MSEPVFPTAVSWLSATSSSSTVPWPERPRSWGSISLTTTHQTPDLALLLHRLGRGPHQPEQQLLEFVECHWLF